MVIDTHVHAWAAGSPLDPGRHYTPVRAHPVQALLDTLRAHAVDRAVLVQPSFVGTHHATLLQALAAAPDRLRGVAVVAPGTDAATIDRLHAAGVRGIRFNLVGGAAPPALHDGSWRALTGAIAARGWHLVVAAPQPVLHAVLPAWGHLGLQRVVDHWGLPDDVSDAGLRRWFGWLGAHGAWVKLSAPYRQRPGFDPRRALPLLLESVPVERVLWGSDAPFTRHEDTVDYPSMLAALQALPIDGAPRAAIESGNAARLYHFEAA